MLHADLQTFDVNHRQLMKGAELTKLVNATIANLETLIPSMITFAESPVDLQSWERWANASFSTTTSTDVDLMALMRDVLGHASIPALYGHALLDNHPHLLHDVYEFDRGMMYLMTGLPKYTPWLPVIRAHLARAQAKEAMLAFSKALDARDAGKDEYDGWGDMKDVSDYIDKRNQIMRGRTALDSRTKDRLTCPRRRNGNGRPSRYCRSVGSRR